MNTATFWSIIEAAKATAKGDQEQMTDALDEALRKLTAEEIAGFQHELDLRMNEAYTWPLWGAAYLMNGGCSDDGFEYFRALLIANGRDIYEAAIKDPESIASAKLKFGEEECWEFELLLYVPAEVYGEVTKGKEPTARVTLPADPAGKRWEEEELDGLFPKLARKFGGRAE